MTVAMVAADQGCHPETVRRAIRRGELSCYRGMGGTRIGQSWRQQPGSPVYGTDLDAAGVRDGLAKAQKDRATKWSATANSPGSFDQPA